MSYDNCCNTKQAAPSIEEKLRALINQLENAGFDTVRSAERLAGKLSSLPANNPVCERPLYGNDVSGLVDEAIGLLRQQYAAIDDAMERSHEVVGNFTAPVPCCESKPSRY